MAEVVSSPLVACLGAVGAVPVEGLIAVPVPLRCSCLPASVVQVGAGRAGVV